ncbi:MAG TPA: DapH/DapD/GlmU-related protein [Aquabacterium sp.]|nr:DapH/DapD/GlmU-related protein [Aquabacterium sp.]
MIAGILGVLSYGFIAVAVYRYGRWTRTLRPRLLSYPFKLIYAVLQLLVDMLFGINISTNVEIGPGLYVAHFGGIFLHGHMGAHCSVTQGVTVGYKGGGKSTRPPSIGNNVYIGAGAVIVGDIRIGDNVVVGANTTVVKSVPDNHMVVSAEPRVMPRPS